MVLTADRPTNIRAGFQGVIRDARLVDLARCDYRKPFRPARAIQRAHRILRIALHDVIPRS